MLRNWKVTVKMTLARVGGIALSEKHLRELGNWRGASIVIKRAADVLNAEPYLFGGVLRDWFWKITKRIEEIEETDYDVFLVADTDIYSALKAVSKTFVAYNIMVVHEDTFRIQGKGVKIDFKIGVSAKRAPIDFTVNAIFSPLRPIFEGKEAPVYAANLDDLTDKILRHASSFNMYPFHMVRGIRLVSQFDMKIAPETLGLYRRSTKAVTQIPEPLIHRELTRAVNSGYGRAVWAVTVTDFAPALFPCLKPIRRKVDLWLEHAKFAQNFIDLFDPKNKSREAKYIRGFAPTNLLKKEFAPAGRNLLYCYFISSLLLLANPTPALHDLIQLNFYPAEKFIILSCITGVQTKTKIDDAHPLVKPFLRAYTIFQPTR